MKPQTKSNPKNTRRKVIYFISILLLTVIITRGLVSIKDPNPIFMGFELHHFYYGIILLIITNLAILFGKNHQKLYLSLSAISIGLIIDELVYIASHIESQIHYEATIGSALIFTTIIASIILIILYDLLGRINGKLRLK